VTNVLDANILLRGAIIGFSIAAPVGPIGVLCIRRTLTDGRSSGLVSGLGAATADALYGCVAGFGLTFVSDLLVGQRMWLHLIGGVFLIYLGIRTLLARPSGQATSVKTRGLTSAYGSTLGLTLTNPMTILSFAGVMAGLGIGSTASDYVSAAVLVLGVFIGSALWWLVLSSGVGLLKDKFNARALTWVNWISGAVIIVFGVLALWSNT
jgi:threonine/homoserine/homoserine lactone efflux protein